jgi:hypothetical protein
MTETIVSHPADLAEKGSTYGGFAEIARRLNALHPERPNPFSRQLVERWYKCRGFNNFPERQPVEVREGKFKVLFDLQRVENWYTNWTRKRAGNPPIETIPLFSVDHSGHPIDAEQGMHRGHPDVRGDYRGSVLDL